MAAINAVTDLTREGDIAVLTINSPPVNALSADVRSGLRGDRRIGSSAVHVRSVVSDHDTRAASRKPDGDRSADSPSRASDENNSSAHCSSCHVMIATHSSMNATVE